jgi:hypothetical protein
MAQIAMAPGSVPACDGAGFRRKADLLLTQSYHAITQSYHARRDENESEAAARSVMVLIQSDTCINAGAEHR